MSGTHDHPPQVLSVGTSTPPESYSQEELLALFEVTNPKVAGIFRNSHIARRHLYLPTAAGQPTRANETPLDLWNKHRNGALELGAHAVAQALAPLGLDVRDVDYLTCVSSTGFLCPSLSSHFVARLGFRSDVHRVDVVGMGCNAGLNALQLAANYCRVNAGCVALQLCVEVCSAAYVVDESLGTAVVNSLFGDGAAAVVVAAAREAAGETPAPQLLAFRSHVIPAALNAMRFDFDGCKNSFYLDPSIPYVIGEHVEAPVDALLARFALKRRDVRHWVVHSGGRKVIDAIKYALDLSAHDLRHTQSVLRDYGNLSSGSFLYSLKRLMAEGDVRAGDYVVMITMGPGSSIECCLGRF